MASVEPELLTEIESDVRQRVAAAEPIRWQTLPLAEARRQGAMMLFGEKYPDPVRMVSMGDFSKELCGGTHLSSTAEVGPFEIVSEEGVSAGTRRIVALTGEKAAQHIEQTRETAEQTANLLGVSPAELPVAVKALSRRVRDLKKELSGGGAAAPLEIAAADADATPDYPQLKAALREAARTLNVPPFEVAQRVEAMLRETADLERQLKELASAGDISVDGLLAKADTVGEAQVIVAETPGANPNRMRQLIDQLRHKAERSAILLAAKQGGDKVVLVAGVTKNLIDHGAHAGKWVGQVAKALGGGGGGKADMAQAGGKQPENLPAALEQAGKIIKSQLGG